ncbi:hypothetical protein [Pseudomonas sp. NPDC079086]|uniref:hypothetical protein n=1 Tax=unclassified Pseudomonas TaxID=196821 RepID=UPI0037C6B51F
MTESAQVQRINAQCLAAEPERSRDDKRERYRHRVTNKSYVLILELGGACELEGIGRRCIHQTRDTLDNNEIWERLP